MIDAVNSVKDQHLHHAYAALKELFEHERFGAWQPIVQNINQLYLQALAELAPYVSSAEPLRLQIQGLRADKQYLIFGDPYFRIILHRALNLKAESNTSSASKDLDAWDEAELACSLILAYLLEVGDTLNQTLLQIFGFGGDRQHYLGAAPFQVVLWQPQTLPSPFTVSSGFEALFRREILPGFASPTVTLRSPKNMERQSLAQALKILRRVWPRMLVETIAHVKVIGLVEQGQRTAENGDIESSRHERWANGSNYAVPGSIFLSSFTASQPLRAAQAIFHETTHQKAGNLVTTLSLLKDDYRQCGIARIEPPWHRGKEVWSVDRSLFALHYYVHSIPFYVLLAENWVELVGEYGEPEGQQVPDLLARQGVERAAFLHGQIMQRASAFLEPEGRELMDWLGHQLERFDKL